MFQLKLAMGDIKEQKHVLKAQANIKKTWEDLLAEGHVPDRDAPLAELLPWGDAKNGSILLDPASSVVGLILFIYQMENFCFSELNRSSRYKDQSKVPTLGPWAAALYDIILGT